MINNKLAISKLKDYSELAWASYFYFDLLEDAKGNPRKIYELDSKGDKIKDEYSPRGYKEIQLNLEHIVSKKYQGQEVLDNFKQGDDLFNAVKNQVKDVFNNDKVNGEFEEIQAKNFAKRYEVKIHQKNTLHGFSATLFYDRKNNEYIVAFRGTEGPMDYLTDFLFSITSLNMQNNSLLNFLINIQYKLLLNAKPIIFVGHSLGGYLAQWALIYCDDKYKNLLGFSPKEVYTFNSPSIYGWNFPNTIINPNTMKILREVFDKLSIDTSMKLTHIYNSSGIKLVANAQYGSQNTLPIYTSLNSHSIITLTQTLYFYSYLLESNTNNEELKNKNLRQIIEYLNKFSQALKTHTQFFMPHNINDKNTKKHSNTTHASFLPSFLTHQAENTSHLFLLFATIKDKIHKIEPIKQDEHFKTSQDELIDLIITLNKACYHIKILNKAFFAKLRKETSFINEDKNIAYKACIAQYNNFIIIDKNKQPIETRANLHLFYGYNSSIYQVLSTVWEELFLGACCKIIQGLYYNGKAKLRIL